MAPNTDVTALCEVKIPNKTLCYSKLVKFAESSILKRDSFELGPRAWDLGEGRLRLFGWLISDHTAVPHEEHSRLSDS